MSSWKCPLPKLYCRGHAPSGTGEGIGWGPSRRHPVERWRSGDDDAPVGGLHHKALGAHALPVPLLRRFGMTSLHISVTDDRQLVLELLRLWKPMDAHAYVRSGKIDALIGRVDGNPVGVLLGTHDFGNWKILEAYQHLTEIDSGSYVQAIFVLPDHRYGGVGAGLLTTFVERAEERGSPVVVAWPDEDEQDFRARVRFFERNGFDWLEYPGGVRPAWLMGRSLK